VLVPADRRRLQRVPITSPARTVLDCSGLPHAATLLPRWVDELIRRQLLHPEELRAARDRLRPARGRSLALVDRILERLQPGFQPGDSAPELRIADWLEAAGYGRPVLGAEVRLPGRRRALRPDGLYPEEKVGFEYQSWQHHGSGQVEPFHDDPKRMNVLRANGYDIYPFTAASTAADVVEAIGPALERARRTAALERLAAQLGA
jgi:hypothetical protein